MIHIEDILYVRYQAPDLDVMERFLLDFGLHRAHRTATTLYMRANGTSPYVHVTDLGPVRRQSYALLAAHRDDLETLARACGARVEPNREPAGGWQVRLQDPSGFDITVLADIQRVAPLPVRPLMAGNIGPLRARLGQPVRVPTLPCHVLRLGHVALRCSDLAGSFRFLTEHLGFRVSDSGWAGTPDNIVGHFLHCGLGDRWTDHHTIAIFQRPASQFDHSAFEVMDMDDLMAGHRFLRERAYRHAWGIGRHVAGSQVFDYWRDPWDNKIEHWTDGDQVNDSTPAGLDELNAASLFQWGPGVPADFYQ